MRALDMSYGVLFWLPLAVALAYPLMAVIHHFLPNSFLGLENQLEEIIKPITVKRSTNGPQT